MVLCSLAPGYEFFISDLTKVKCSSLTIFWLFFYSYYLPYQSETHLISQIREKDIQKDRIFVKYK